MIDRLKNVEFYIPEHDRKKRLPENQRTALQYRTKDKVCMRCSKRSFFSAHIKIYQRQPRNV